LSTNGIQEVARSIRVSSTNKIKRFSFTNLLHFGKNERRDLAAAAVVGRSFSFQPLTAISQSDVDELFTVIEKAQRMGIIVPSSRTPERPFIFTHELVRQTLLGGISGPRRQQLHAGIAHAIARLYSDAVERAGIAAHLAKARSFTIGNHAGC
jgi:predicted ATPase